MNTKPKTSNKSTTPHSRDQDGVTHINIQSGHAQTELGKQLSLHYPHVWDHDSLGRFSSMENFWHYVRYQGAYDELRHLPIHLLRSITSGLKPVQLDNFRHIILDGYRQRIETDPELLDMFLNNELPFIAYQTVSFGQSRRLQSVNKGLKFVIEGINDLHRTMRSLHSIR